MSKAATEMTTSQPPAVRATTRRMALALFITLGFVLIEAAAGIIANSLALLTDAVHNLTDVIALALSWYAVRLTLRPAHSGKTYGYHRAGILIALFNSTTLVLIALRSAAMATRQPTHVDSREMPPEPAYLL